MTEQARKQRRKGQTLAEFALTLPILLVLIFGVVEFGRIFQAWVTIQNAAREATRYTTTGQYDEEKYNIDALLPCDIDDLRGTRRADPQGSGVEIFAQENGSVLTFDQEALFATYYDGQNCDPGNAEHEERRKDILRLASIYDVARIGASGLLLEDSMHNGTRSGLVEQLFKRWNNPVPGSDQPRYFDVLVCSTRAFLDELSEPAIEDFDARFVTIYDNGDLPVGYPHDFETPFCMLNERPPDLDPMDTIVPVDNAGYPWIDPGGPGDRVDVIITFNHPLITPLPLTEYLTIQSRRSGVNETFRQARALNAVQGTSPQTADQNDADPSPVPSDTFTPSATTVPSDAPENTQTPTATDLPTQPPPFSCDLIDVSGVQMTTSGVQVIFESQNFLSAELQSVTMRWNRPPTAPNMFMQLSSFDTEVHWQGVRNDSDFTLADPAVIPGSDLTTESEINDWNRADRLLGGTNLGGSSVTTFYEARFANAGNVASVLSSLDFGGTEFVFINPETGAPCVEILPGESDVTPTPTLTEDPNATFTPTFTPDCASTSLSIDFDGFETFGVVRLQVENRRNASSPFLGMELFWFDSDPEPFVGVNNDVASVVEDIEGNENALYLQDVWVSPSTGSAFGPTSVKVWEGPDYFSQTDNYPGGRTDGTWLQNYDFPPNSISYVYLNYDGTGGRLNQVYDMESWMFNGFFWIDCTLPGTGESGSGGAIRVGNPYFDNPIPDPTDFPTDRPTNTPIPPSPTFTDEPPTLTPSITPIPSETPLPTATDPPPTETDVPTVIFGEPTDPRDGGGGGG